MEIMQLKQIAWRLAILHIIISIPGILCEDFILDNMLLKDNKYQVMINGNRDEV